MTRRSTNRRTPKPLSAEHEGAAVSLAQSETDLNDQRAVCDFLFSLPSATHNANSQIWARAIQLREHQKRKLLTDAQFIEEMNAHAEELVRVPVRKVSVNE